LTRASILMFGM